VKTMHLKLFLCFLTVIFTFCFSNTGYAKSKRQPHEKPRVVYKKETKVSFDGLAIEGEINNPGEFYFQHKKQNKPDSLVKKRKNFQREMLRDAVLSK